MFEKTLARLLTSALGAYVDDLNAEQLRLGLFGGRLHLRNLRLRTSAFDALQLPIELVGGCIGELDITIPWTSLFSSTISIIVRDVCIVARPQWNLSRDRISEWDKIFKTAQLEAYEALKMQLRDALSNSGVADSGNSDTLLSSIIGRISISIESVHFRFEDPDPILGRYFCLGLQFSRLGISESQQSDSSHSSEFKSIGLSLSDFCIYIDHSETKGDVILAPEVTSNSELLIDFMHVFNSHSKSSKSKLLEPKHFHLLAHMDFELIFQMCINDDQSKFQFQQAPRSLHCVVPAVNCSVDQFQVGYLLSLNRKMSTFKAHVSTLSRIVLPLQSSSTSIVKQHWHVAIHSTIALLRKQSTDLSWTRIKKFRNDLRLYVPLYKSRIFSLGSSVASFDDSALRELEANLNVQDILVMRAFAEYEVDLLSCLHRNFLHFFPEVELHAPPVPPLTPSGLLQRVSSFMPFRNFIAGKHTSSAPQDLSWQAESSTSIIVQMSNEDRAHYQSLADNENIYFQDPSIVEQKLQQVKDQSISIVKGFSPSDMFEQLPAETSSEHSMPRVALSKMMGVDAVLMAGSVQVNKVSFHLMMSNSVHLSDDLHHDIVHFEMKDIRLFGKQTISMSQFTAELGNCTLTDSGAGVEYSSSWPSRPFLHMFGPRGCASPNPKWIKHWQDSASTALSKRRRDTVAVAARAASHGFARDRRHVQESEDIIVEWRSAILHNDHVARIRHPFVSVQLDTSATDQPQTNVSVNIAPFDVVLSLPVLLDCRQFMALATRMSPLPDESIKVNVPHATHLPTFSHIGDFSRRVESKRHAAAALASHVHIDICLKSCALIVPFHSANPTCLPVDCRLDDDEQIFANALMQHSLAGSCLVVDIGVVRVQQRKKCSCGTFSLDGPVSSFADAFYSCVRPVHLVNIAASSSEKCADASSLCNEPLLNENEIAQFDDRRVDAEDVLASCPHVEDFYHSVVVSSPMIDVLLTPGWLLRDNSAQWRAMLDVEHTSSFDFQSRDLHISGREQMKLLSVVGTLLRFQPNLLEGDDWLPEALVSLEFKSIGIQISSSSYQWSRLIVDSLASFSPSVEAPPADHPIPVDLSGQAAPNRNHHKFRSQLAVHSLSVTFHIDAPLAFVACRPVQPFDLVGTSKRLFHVSNHLATFSLDLLCARAWKSFAGLQTAAQLGSVCLEYEAYPIGHPARYLLRAGSRNFIPSAAIAGLCNADQEPLGLHNFAELPTAISIHCFSWSEASMRHCNSSRSLPSDPFNVELNASSFEALPRSPLLSIRRNVSDDAAVWIPSHLIFGDLKKVAIDSICVHWQRDVFRSLQNMFLYDLTLLGKDPNPIQGVRAFSHISFETLLNTSCTSQWQSQLNSIFSALVSKIQSCEGKQEEIADASLVECFDSKSSRLCLAVRSFSLDFYRGVPHDPSPETTLPPLPSMDSPHCLSAQGATKFDNILIRSWPLQPLFPSMPLHLALVPPNTSSFQFSEIVSRALAKSLLNPEEFNWSWNWGLTSELPFARTAFNSFAFIYSADSKLNRAQVQLSDLTMTDLAANSRFPLVISRQDVTSSFCVDAAWVEPVTFSGVRQKFAAPVVPSPLRLLLPRTSLIVESSVYVIRASSLKVIMALPFFMQLKEYFANEVLLETGLPLLPSHGLLGPIAPDLTKFNVSFERIFAHIPHRAISPETAPAYTRLHSEAHSSQPWPGSGPIEWIILQFPRLDLSNSWFLEDCNTRIQIDQADITPAVIPCSQTDIRISNFLITRRTLQAAPVNFLDRTSLSISISVPIRAGLPLGVIVEPTALQHPLFDATFPLGFTEFTSKRVRAHMESIELDISASEIELLRTFAATDVSFMLGIPPSKPPSSPIDDVHKPRPQDPNAHFVSEWACKVRDIDMQFQVSNFCLQLFASQCGQLHVATSTQNLLVDDQTFDDTCLDMLDISSRLAGVDLFNDAAAAKPSPGNLSNVVSTVMDIASQQCIEGPWLLRSMTERRTNSRLQMLFCLDVHNVNVNLIQQIERSVQIYVGHASNSSGKYHIFKFHGINLRTANTELTVQDLNFECRHHILLDHFQSMLSCRGDQDQKDGMRFNFCTETSQDSNDLLQKCESSSISVASTEFRIAFHTASVALLSHLLTAWASIRSPQYLLNYYSFLHSERPTSSLSQSAAKEHSFPNLHLKLQIGIFRLWIVQDRTLCMRQSVSGLASESDLPALHQDMFRTPPSLLLHTSIDVELQRFTHQSRQWWDHQVCAKFVNSGLRLYFQTLPHLMQSDNDSVGVPLLLPLTTEFHVRVYLPAFNHILSNTAFSRPDFQCNVTLSLIDICFTSKDIIACADIVQNVEWCLGRLKESLGKLTDYMNHQQPAPIESCPPRVFAPPETPRRHVKAQQFLFSPGGAAHMSAPSTVNRRMTVPLAIPELEHVSSTSSSSREAPSKLLGFDFGLFDALHGKFEFNCAGVRIVLMDDSNFERQSPSPLCNLSLQQCSLIIAGTSVDSLHSFFVHPEFWSWGKCVAESLFDADFAPIDVGHSQHRILTVSVQAQIDIFNSRTCKFECVLEQSLLSLGLSRVAFSDGLKAEISVPTIVDLCLSDQIISEIVSVSGALELTTKTCQRVVRRDLANLAASLPAELYLCRFNNDSGVRLRLNSKSNLSSSSDWGVSKAPKARAEAPSWLHESHVPRTRRLHSDESGLHSKSENVAARRGFGTLSHAISTNLFSGLLQKQHSVDNTSYVYLEPGHQILIESYSIAVGGDRRYLLSCMDGHRQNKSLDTSVLPFVIEFEPSPGHAWHAFPNLPLVPKQSSVIGTQTTSKWFQGQSVLGSRDLFLDKISRHSVKIPLQNDGLSSNDSEYRMLLKIDQLNLSSSSTLHFISHLGVRNESAHTVHVRIKVKSNQKSQESTSEYHSFIIQPNQSCMIPSFLNKESRIRITPHNLSADRQLQYNFADIGCVDDWLNRFSPFESKFVPCFPLPTRWKSARARLPFTSSFPDLSKSEDADDAIGNDASTFNSSRLKSVWSSPDLRPLNSSVTEALPALPAMELNQSESSRPSLENEQDSFDRACWYSVFSRPGDPDETSYSDQIDSYVQNDESQQCPRMITITAPLTLVNTLPQKCNIVISTQHVQAAPVQNHSLASSNVIGLPRLEALSSTSSHMMPLHGRSEIAESDSDDEFVDDRDVFASNGLVVDPLDLRYVRIDLQRDEFKSSGAGSEPMIALLLGLDSGQSHRCHFLPPHCRKWWRVQLLPHFKSWSRAVLLETGVCLSGSSARSPLPGSSIAEIGNHQFSGSSAPSTPPVMLSPVFRRHFPQSPSSPAVHSPLDQSDPFHQRSTSHFNFSGLHSSSVDNYVHSAIQAVETNSGFSYFSRFCAGLTDSDRQLLIARTTHVFDRKMDALEIIFDHCSTLQCADERNSAMHAFADPTHPHLVALFVPFWIRNHTMMPLQFGFSQSARSVQAALSAAAASQAAKVAAQKQAWLKDRVLNVLVGGAPSDESRDEPIKLGGISLVAGQDDVDDDFFNEKGSFQPTRSGMQSSHRPGLGALLSTAKKRRPNNRDLQLETELSVKSDIIMFSPFNESMHSPFSESNRRKLSVREGSNLECLRIRKVGLSALVSNPHDIWSWVSPLPGDTSSDAESDRSSWGFKVIDTAASNRSIVLSAKVSTAETVFWRTNMLDVMSRIMVLNATDVDIEIGQSFDQSPISTSCMIAPADHKACVLSADQNTNQINFSCKLSGINCMWSGIVSVEAILQQSQTIRLNRILNSDSTPGVIDHVSHLPWYVNFVDHGLRSENLISQVESIFLRLEAALIDGIIHISIVDDRIYQKAPSLGGAPIVIRNFSQVPVYFCQSMHGEQQSSSSVGISTSQFSSLYSWISFNNDDNLQPNAPKSKWITQPESQFAGLQLQCLLPQQSCGFAWDRPCDIHEVVFALVAGKVNEQQHPATIPVKSQMLMLGSYAADQISSYPSIDIPWMSKSFGSSIRIEVFVENGNYVMQVLPGTGYSASTSLMSSNSISTASQSKDLFQASADFAGFGLSVIETSVASISPDSSSTHSFSRELLYLSATGINIKVNSDFHRTQVASRREEYLLSMHSFQIDDQLSGTVHPVVLGRTHRTLANIGHSIAHHAATQSSFEAGTPDGYMPDGMDEWQDDSDSDESVASLTDTNSHPHPGYVSETNENGPSARPKSLLDRAFQNRTSVAHSRFIESARKSDNEPTLASPMVFVKVTRESPSTAPHSSLITSTPTPTANDDGNLDFEDERVRTHLIRSHHVAPMNSARPIAIKSIEVQLAEIDMNFDEPFLLGLYRFYMKSSRAQLSDKATSSSSSISSVQPAKLIRHQIADEPLLPTSNSLFSKLPLPAQLRSIIFRPTPSFPLIQSLVIGEMLFNLSFSASPPVAQSETSVVVPAPAADVPEVDDMSWWPLPAWLHEVGATLFQLNRAPIKVCTLNVLDLYVIVPTQPLAVRLFEETSPFRRQLPVNIIAPLFTSPLKPIIDFYVEQASGQVILKLGESNPLLGDPGAFAKSLRDGWDHLHRQRQQDGSTVSGIKHFAQLTVFGAASSARLIANSIAEGLQRLDSQATGFATQVASPPRIKARSNVLGSPNGASSKFSFDWLREMLHLPARKRNTDGSTSAASPATQQMSEPGSASVMTALSLDQSAVALADTNHDGVWSVASGSVRGFNSILFGPFLGFQVIGLPTVLKTTRYPAHIALQMGSDVARTVARGADTVREWYQPSQQIVQLCRIRAPRVFAGGLRVTPYDSVPPLLLSLFDEYLAERRRMLANPERRPTDMLSTSSGMPSRIHVRSVHSSLIRDHECYLSHCISLTHGRALIFTSRAMLVVRLPQTQRARASSIRAAESRVEYATSSTGTDSKQASRSGLARLVKPETAAQAASVEFKLPHAHSSYSEAALLQPLCPGAWRKLLMERVPLECITRVDVDGHSVRLSVTAPGASATKDAKGLGPLSLGLTALATVTFDAVRTVELLDCTVDPLSILQSVFPHSIVMSAAAVEASARSAAQQHAHSLQMQRISQAQSQVAARRTAPPPKTIKRAAVAASPAVSTSSVAASTSALESVFATPLVRRPSGGALRRVSMQRQQRNQSPSSSGAATPSLPSE